MQHEEKCEVCGQKATVHVTLVKNGQNHSIDFCFKHAKEAGIFQAQSYSLINKKNPNQQLVQSTKCNCCGLSLKEFQKMGRLGCEHCYDAFKSQIMRILPHVGQGTAHTGKSPIHLVDPQFLRERLKSLRKDLQIAIDKEHYEEAANTRDQIADILAQLEEGPS